MLKELLAFYKSNNECMFTDCYCTQFRRASNGLTRVYDAALRPAGIRITQFSLLRSLGRLGEASSTQISSELSLDRTTISRNLKLLIDAGWVDVIDTHGKDRRERMLRLNASGQKVIANALPYFLDAQKTVENGADEFLNAPTSERLMRALINLQNAGDKVEQVPLN